MKPRDVVPGVPSIRRECPCRCMTYTMGRWCGFCLREWHQNRKAPAR